MFLLSHAMGGGKTHSMIALGLLAQDPALRGKVLSGDQDPAPSLGACRVAGFNGRSTVAAGGIWGSIAEQLGKAEQFARYVSPLLSAPGPEAWKHMDVNRVSSREKKKMRNCQSRATVGAICALYRSSLFRRAKVRSMEG